MFYGEILRMNFFKINKLLKLILVVVIINFLVSFVNQQSKLNSYREEISRYEAQKASLIEQTEELLATQQNVNSEEYIEKVAREELDMYLPNEIVYIDISK